MTEDHWLDIPNPLRMLIGALEFQLQQTQAFQFEKLAAIQLKKLNQLIQHSIKTVPYYKNLPGKHISNWKDWYSLPTISRKQLQSAGKRLHSNADLSRTHGQIGQIRSSGSTGTPIQALTCEKVATFWRAITIRDHLWHSRDVSQSMAIIRYAKQGEKMYPGVDSPDWGAATTTFFSTGPSFFLNSAASIDDQFRWLKEKSPGYLLIYPTLLKELARINLANGRPVQINCISTVGEALPDGIRELVMDSFGTRICDIYSAQEVGYMALQCPEHDHYHIQSEMNLVEILDEDNQPCPPGTMGKVVVTSLHNHVMPLIRYEIGDHAVPGEACDCGINLPVIERIAGRTRNLVTYPDGSRSWPKMYNLDRLMPLVPRGQFQIVQNSLEQLTVRVCAPEAIGPQTKDIIMECVRGAIGHDFAVRVEQVDKIERSKNGKYEEFHSEIQEYPT